MVDLDHRPGVTASGGDSDQLRPIRSTTATNAHPHRTVTHRILRGPGEISHNLY
jgi:hypothetical protein